MKIKGSDIITVVIGLLLPICIILLDGVQKPASYAEEIPAFHMAMEKFVYFMLTPMTWLFTIFKYFSLTERFTYDSDNVTAALLWLLIYLPIWGIAMAFLVRFLGRAFIALVKKIPTRYDFKWKWPEGW